MTHARPGVPLFFTFRQVCLMLGLSHWTVRRDRRLGLLKGHRRQAKGRWRFRPIDVVRYCRTSGLDLAPVRAACRPRHGRVMLVTADKMIESGAASLEPVVLPDLFSLGRQMAAIPALAVVVDFDHVGREWAYQAASQLAREGDHPLLVAVTDGEAGRPKKPKGVWDLFLTRQAAADRLGPTVTHLLGGTRKPAKRAR